MKDFKPQVAALKEQVLKGQDFGQIMTFFFDHLGDHPHFLHAGRRVEHPVVEAVVAQVLQRHCRRKVPVFNLLLIQVPDTTFMHGGFMTPEGLGQVIYFEDVDKGLVTLSNMVSGRTDIFRFTCVPVNGGIASN